MEKLTRESLVDALRAAGDEYAAADESYGFDPYVALNTESGDVTLIATEEVPETDADAEEGIDYYPLLDLTRMDPAEPGHWTADEEAIDSIADSYC